MIRRKGIDLVSRTRQRKSPEAYTVRDMFDLFPGCFCSFLLVSKNFGVAGKEQHSREVDEERTMFDDRVSCGSNVRKARANRRVGHAGELAYGNTNINDFMNESE